MPYTGIDDPNLPDHVQKLPKKKRKAWVGAFNSSYEKCIADGGDSDKCEGRSFRIANGVVKKMSDLSGILRFELADDVLTEGKPFAGFAVGKFVDMYGRRVVTEDDDLPEYLANTQEQIEMYIAKEMPGLPIDAKLHDKAEAAGWITKVEMGEVEDSEGKVVKAIMFFAQWTKLGVDAIQNKIMANFSPTFNDRDKVILGGSLTNWPATKDENGVPLLNAIQLCQGGYAMGFANLQDESLDERMRRVRDAWYAAYTTDDMGPYIYEVFDDHVIVRDAEDCFRVAYAYSEDDGIEFADRETWVKIKQVWVEAADRELPESSTPDSETHGEADTANDAEPVNNNLEGGTVMENLLLANLSEEDRQALLKQARKEIVDNLPQDADLVERLREQVDLVPFEQITDLATAREKMLEQMQAAMRAEYARMQAQAGSMLNTMLAEIQRDQQIADFAQKVTGGTDETPYGVPVQEDEIVTFLHSLDDQQRAAAINLINRFWEKGRVPFAELGHGGRSHGVIPLPEYYAEKLDAGEMDIRDLADPVLGLGDIGQYDLSKWKKEKEA